MSQSLEETFLWGVTFGKRLSAGTILTLKGDLGSGKTTLMKGIAHGILGIDPNHVTSPTFTYLNIYSTEINSIYHFDLYRLQGSKDFLALGLEEYFTAGGICCIEWPERISNILPENTTEIILSHLSEGQRSIKIFEKA